MRGHHQRLAFTLSMTRGVLLARCGRYYFAYQNIAVMEMQFNDSFAVYGGHGIISQLCFINSCSNNVSFRGFDSF